MRFRTRWGATFAALFCAFSISAAAAELEVSTGYFGEYVYRGLTVVNRPVLQPEVAVGAPFGPGHLVLGAWGNLEVGTYDGLDDFSLAEEAGSWSFTQFKPSAHVSLPTGPVETTLGVIGTIFPDQPEEGGLENTAEAHAGLRFRAPFLSPRADVWYDFVAFDGAYGELGVSQGIPLAPVVSLELDAAAGFSLGQASQWQGQTLEELGSFADEGLTHVEIGASLPIGFGSMTFAPTVRASRAYDAFTKITAPDSEDDLKVWGGFTLGWARGLGTGN